MDVSIMNQNNYLWILISTITFISQMLLGTNIIFASMALFIFIATPYIFRYYASINNVGGVIFIATFLKLFIISQWLKILYLQPADTHLQAPQETVFVLLLGLAAFGAAGLAATPLVRGRGGLVKIPQDPTFLAWLAVAAAILTFIGMIARHLLGYDRIGEEEYVHGQGHVLFMYLDGFFPLAVAALTARAALLSGGRRFFDGFVVAALVFTVFQGFWENIRTGMVSGGVAFLVTYWVYGGKFGKRHIFGLLICTVFMQWLVFPLIDIQRGLPRNLSAMEFISETLRIAGDLTDQKSRFGYDEQLENTYLSWDTRLYYGDPTGFFDRFAPNALDEVVAHFERAAPFGVDALTEQVAFFVPNMLLGSLGLERPTRGGDQIEMAVLGTLSNMNYGMFAEVYAFVGQSLFLPVCCFIVFIYITVIHFIYGGLRQNYFLAFMISSSFFTLAGSDISELQAEIGLRGGLHLAVFLAVRWMVHFWKAGRPQEMGLSGR